MRKRLRHYGFAACLIVPGAEALADAGWTDYVPVRELTPTIHERFIVRLAASENPSGCRSKEYFYQNYEIRGSDKMFHVLLEALASGHQVRVYVTGRCDLKGYSEISSVTIVP